MTLEEKIAVEFCTRCLGWSEANTVYAGDTLITGRMPEEHLDFSNLNEVHARSSKYCRDLGVELNLTSFPDGTFSASINGFIMAFADTPEACLMGACLTAKSRVEDRKHADRK